MRIVVGITGSTGAQLGYRLVELLGQTGAEAHVVISRWGEKTLEQETGHTAEDLAGIAHRIYPADDMAASISSGSYPVDGMIIIPCSMKTLSAVANGYADNLIARAADVTLKERRRLVVVARETPLNTIHLRNMLTLSEMGAVIMPPVMSYYTGLHEQQLMDSFLGRVLRQVGVENSFYPVWGAEQDAP